MLSGLQDEVVPREHMQGLWEIVQRREANQPAGTGTNSKEARGKKLPGVEGARTDEGSPNVKVSVEDVRTLSKFVEFEEGTHSTFSSTSLVMYRSKISQTTHASNQGTGQLLQSSSHL